VTPLERELLDESELSWVEGLLQRTCGLSLTAALRQSVQAGFSSAAQRLGVDRSRFLDALRTGDPRSVSTLVESTVICETYFFRHPEHFRALQELCFRRADPRRALLIWSAGCATGEEPYSLAMALLSAGRAGCGDRVLATDVSERALQTARIACYGEWSMRGLDPLLRNRYFSGEKPAQVISEVRKLVVFQQHNLISDRPPGRFDVIVCRNVLIYFEAETSAQVLHNLASALSPEGLLVLGHAELPLASSLDLEWIDRSGTTILCRPHAGGPAPPKPAHPPRKSPSTSPPAASPAKRAAPVVLIPAVAAPPLEPAPPPKPAADPDGNLFGAAREAARRGDLAEAERLAVQSGESELLPEAHLLLSMTAEARGDLAGATEAARRALYLDPGMAVAHAMLVSLYSRQGRAEESERARRNAMNALEGVEDGVPLRGVESITAGALRRALVPPQP
jgi:chemotaxis protein methyltransferase CheR